MVKPMLVVRIRLTFPDVRMGIVIAKDAANLWTLDTRVVLVSGQPNLFSTSDDPYR